VEVAKQAHGTGTTWVFVVTAVDQPHVVAYYAWCMARVAIADLPQRLRRGAGSYPQPIALMPSAAAACWCTPNPSRPAALCRACKRQLT